MLRTEGQMPVDWKTTRAMFAAAAMLGSLLSGTTAHADFFLSSTSTLDLGSNSLDLGCLDLTLAGGFDAGGGAVYAARDVTITATGTLDGDQALLEVGGDWLQGGSFTAGTSLVRFVDSCGNSSADITGSSSFFGLDLSSTVAKTYTFTAGATTTVTDSFTIQASPQAPVRIRSSSPGTEAFLNLDGVSQFVFAVDVEDNHSIGDPALASGSELGPNTLGWHPVDAAPAAGVLALAALAALLLWSGRQLLRA